MIDCPAIIIFIVIIVAVEFIVVEPFMLDLVIVYLKKNRMTVDNVVEPAVTERKAVIRRQVMNVFLGAVEEGDSLREIYTQSAICVRVSG